MESRAIWLVPMGALMLALLPMPYGYYQLLRVLLFISSAYFAVQEFPNRWMWIFCGFALVYNPMAPLALGRGLWMAVNVLTVVMLFVHMQARLAAGRKE